MKIICMHFIYVSYLIYSYIVVINIQVIYKSFTLIKTVNFTELTFTWMLTIFYFLFGLSFKSLSDAIVLNRVLRKHEQP